MLLLTVVASCTDMKGDNNNGSDGGDEKPKQFTSATEAAVAAKEDMLTAAETVDFGVDKGKLKSSEPAAPVFKYELNWDGLLKADTNTTPESVAGRDAVTFVPLVNQGEVVTVVSLRDENGSYGIGGLGNKQISTELDMVRRANPTGMQGEINIYEVPNLQATIYTVKGSGLYYTSYNNNSIRQGLTAKELVDNLRMDAQRFEKQFRDDLRKGKLVK